MHAYHMLPKKLPNLGRFPHWRQLWTFHCLYQCYFCRQYVSVTSVWDHYSAGQITLLLLCEGEGSIAVLLLCDVSTVQDSITVLLQNLCEVSTVEVSSTVLLLCEGHGSTGQGSITVLLLCEGEGSGADGSVAQGAWDCQGSSPVGNMSDTRHVTCDMWHTAREALL